tara:strand:+ start:19400 stop:19729 length:330 start_codon:yes stop_codon:yes gene_type:complete
MKSRLVLLVWLVLLFAVANCGGNSDAEDAAVDNVAPDSSAFDRRYDLDNKQALEPIEYAYEFSMKVSDYEGVLVTTENMLEGDLIEILNDPNEVVDYIRYGGEKNVVPF